LRLRARCGGRWRDLVRDGVSAVRAPDDRRRSRPLQRANAATPKPSRLTTSLGSAPPRRREKCENIRWLEAALLVGIVCAAACSPGDAVTMHSGTAGGGGGSSAPTAGCGKTTWPLTNDQSGSTPYTLTINGTTREYYVSVPATYNASQSTRVVFAWHWRTATARSVTGGGFGGEPYYGLKTRIPDAIYIAAEGLADNGVTGWANTGGRDIAFLRAMLDWLDANYCVDKSRIFSVGFSYGGIMSDQSRASSAARFAPSGPSRDRCSAAPAAA
jgi:hypothetical protein